MVEHWTRWERSDERQAWIKRWCQFWNEEDSVRKNIKWNSKEVIFQCVSPGGYGTGLPKDWAAINWGVIACTGGGGGGGGGAYLTNAGAPLGECAFPSLPLKLLWKFQLWFPCSWLRLPPWFWWWWIPFWFLCESRWLSAPPWGCDAKPLFWFWPLGEGLCEVPSTSKPCDDGWEAVPLAVDPEAPFRLNDLWREWFGVGLGLFARPTCFGAGAEALAAPYIKDIENHFHY